MKNDLLLIALGLIFGATAHADGTRVTCLLSELDPGRFSEILQIEHSGDGKVLAGIGTAEGDWAAARLGHLRPARVKADRGTYSYAFSETVVHPRQTQGAECGTPDVGDSVWRDVTAATVSRARRRYFLSLNAAAPERSAFTTRIKEDCLGGWSFFGPEGHWSENLPVETKTVDCRLEKL